MISRFAPSTTGDAHPGTLLSALLVWLDARARGGRAILRLEDLDPERAKGAWSARMREAMAWFGLAWDAVVVQSERAPAHAAAMDALAAAGRLYACRCSRADRAASGRRAPDGGWAYANTCRARGVIDWRSCGEALRARLDDDRVDLVDELGVDLSQRPAYDMGDPIVRRKDGAIAYQLAVVVDDAGAQITDVVRGRDIAPSTATQIMLQRLLGYPQPTYRHHFLLLEGGGGDKLSKLHGSIPLAALQTLPAARVRAQLEALVGGLPFAWAKVPRVDYVATFAGNELALAPIPARG